MYRKDPQLYVILDSRGELAGSGWTASQAAHAAYHASGRNTQVFDPWEYLEVGSLPTRWTEWHGRLLVQRGSHREASAIRLPWSIILRAIIRGLRADQRPILALRVRGSMSRRGGAR